VVDAALGASSSDLSVDVAMEESSPNMDLPAIRASASASAAFDISESSNDEIRTSSLADLAQGSFQAAPVGEIEIESDGSPDDELELAPANDFVPGALMDETPARVAAPPPPPAAPSLSKPLPARAAAPVTAADGGEATLRAALSQASKDVIEKIAWEVVPQLAEVIIREHVERLARERSSK
jgi:hypothetical protein